MARLATVTGFLLFLLLPPAAHAGRPSLANTVSNTDFVVHYPNSVSTADANAVLGHVSALPAQLAPYGFGGMPPDSDDADPRYDIYLDELSFPGINHGTHFHLRADALYAGTIAHEYIHSVQFYIHPSNGRPGWLVEGIAYWLSERLFPHPHGPVMQPFESLFCPGDDPALCPPGQSLAASFAEYLTSRFGTTVISDVYYRIRAGNPPPFTGFNYSDPFPLPRLALIDEIESHGTTLAEVFGSFARDAAFPTFGQFAGFSIDPPDDPTYFSDGRWGATAIHDLSGRDLPTQTVTSPGWGMKFVAFRAPPSYPLRVTVDGASSGVVTLQTYHAAEGIREIDGGTGATRTYLVPPSPPGVRLVHLVLGNNADADASWRVSASATRPLCGGRTTTLSGTEGRDVLNGTPRADVIAGLGGTDLVRGRGGNDVICGGASRDRLFGGGGRDRIYGEGGRDLLNGGKGTDVLRGGAGRDSETQ